jgi:hypothetical protein
VSEEKSNMERFAEAELARIGMPEGCAGIEADMRKCILDLVKMFSSQGHSGMSGSYCLGVVKKLLAWEPVTPLTGAEDEWGEISEGIFQNKRCSRVFKDSKNGHAYDIEGYVFKNQFGHTYTNSYSRRLVVFPYTPITEYVEVYERSEEDAPG